MSNAYTKALTNLAGKVGDIHLCNCIGPQNGQPVCPCQMKNVVVRDGRYIRKEQDLGPVPEASK